VKSKALGEIDRAAAGYRLAREQVATVEGLVAELKERRKTSQRMFDAGEIDALSLANAQVKFNTGELARISALAKAQQALAALEDAMQTPLSTNTPPSNWEKNPREKLQTSRSKHQ